MKITRKTFIEYPPLTGDQLYASQLLFSSSFQLILLTADFAFDFLLGDHLLHPLLEMAGQKTQYFEGNTKDPLPLLTDRPRQTNNDILIQYLKQPG